MTKRKTVAATAIAGALGSMASGALAEDLTLCWAAWDPANALVELSKEFEAQSGHTMNFEFVPWPNFADRMLNELNSGGKLCDLLIGDSQWIGGGAENGHYVKLNDFFDAEGISDGRFRTRRPSMPILPGRRARRTTMRCPRWATRTVGSIASDWFENPDIARRPTRKATGEGPGRAQDAEGVDADRVSFFQGREIDGQTRYGVSIFTERGSEGITMGATGALYAWGFKYENEPGTYDMVGAVNSRRSRRGAGIL